MRKLILAAAFAAAATSVPSPAAAAMCFDFTLSPSDPQVGEVVSVDVKTQWTTGLTVFALRVFAPDGSTTQRRLSQVGAEEHWKGTLVFDVPGTWAIQAEIAVPSNQYPCFYTTIAVGPSATATQAVDGRAAAVALLALLGLVSGLFIRRRRRASVSSSTSRSAV